MNNGNPFAKQPKSSNKNNFNLDGINIIAVAVLAFIAIGIFVSFKIIDTRERGILKYMGKIEDRTLMPGINFAIPFVSSIETVNVTNTRYEISSIKIYTKDQQRATLDIVVNYNINPSNVVALYKDLGSLHPSHIQSTLMLPVLKSSITNELGQWTAAEVIRSKEKIAQHVLDSLVKNVEAKNLIQFINFEIINIDLDDEYEKSVRQKVVAEQKAEKASNDTKRIQEEAKQMLISAEGEAKAMKIKSESLSNNRNLIEYEKVQVEKARVEKWNGQMPTTMIGGNTPMIFSLDQK
jgi:regulator of protease activity HflC (stomatin/prohibitin superfamily)